MEYSRDAKDYRPGETVTLEHRDNETRVTAKVSAKTLADRAYGTLFLDVYPDMDTPLGFNLGTWAIVDHVVPEPIYRAGTVVDATVTDIEGVYPRSDVRLFRVNCAGETYWRDEHDAYVADSRVSNVKSLSAIDLTDVENLTKIILKVDDRLDYTQVDALAKGIMEKLENS